ncbi:hypothetical protein [Mycobacteroides abscessus]|uniref:hypothetical protein n=1 Tax=Mycobacteroides abscessus TaxID=36809 RepID=UPI0012FFDC09|nr:hypothetical protein [Mycobacteroides abscessus]
MTDEKTVTVIPAPLGLTLLDPQGGPALPIVALEVEVDGYERTVTPLYLGESGRAVPVPPSMRIGMSEHWSPVVTSKAEPPPQHSNFGI